jgi:hypothetical protein
VILASAVEKLRVDAQSIGFDREPTGRIIEIGNPRVQGEGNAPGCRPLVATEK